MADPVIQNYFIDDASVTDTKPPGSDALFYLADEGTAFIARSFLNKTGTALQFGATQDVFVASSMTINGSTLAMDFLGANSKLSNSGAIYSLSGTGISFAGGGTSYVTNQGSIVAKDGIKIASGALTDRLDLFNSGSIIVSNVAVTGGKGDDHVVNSGTLRTTGDVLMDLGDGNDIYQGGSGSAFGKIMLGAGNDKAYGGSGSEIFAGGAGNDYMDGGAGSDTVDYSDFTTTIESQKVGVTVDLTKTTWQEVQNETITGGHGTDLLLNVENVIGTDYNDTLIGNSADNSLSGGTGTDLLEGGAGNDILNGGGGVDTVRYNGSAALILNLDNDQPQNTGGYGWDTVIDVENVEGGNGADVITGDEHENYLNGNFGNDKLSGGAGKDELEGYFGDDTLEGGEGDDVLKGGAGNDMAVFSGTRNDYTINVTTGDESTQYTVTHKIVDPTDSTHTIVGANGVDTLTGIRVLKFLGSDASDTDDVTYALTNGAATAVTLSGSGVKESSDKDVYVGALSAADPDGDVVTYTLLDDAGGRFKLDSDGRILTAKDDALDYDTTGGTYTIKVRVSDRLKNLDGSADSGTTELTVTVKIINELEDTAVTRYGTDAAESLTGEYSHDQIHGFGGNDFIYGNKGNDLVWGDGGNDSIVGGAAMSLSDTESGNDTLFGGDGDDSIFGSDGNDSLYGDAGNDSLYGGSGDDALYGGLGNDLISGNEGNDVLSGGKGKDYLHGGAGFDTFVFDVRSSKANVDQIADFDPTYDTINLSKAAFSKIAKGTLKAGAFVVGNAFKQSDDRILYIKKAGALFYDPDGSGKADAIQFANIGKNLALTHKDFIIF